MSIFSKIFGTHSQHEVKRIIPIVDKIEALAPEFEKLTDDELKAKTPEFKARLEKGETCFLRHMQQSERQQQEFLE